MVGHGNAFCTALNAVSVAPASAPIRHPTRLHYLLPTTCMTTLLRGVEQAEVLPRRRCWFGKKPHHLLPSDQLQGMGPRTKTPQMKPPSNAQFLQSWPADADEPLLRRGTADSVALSSPVNGQYACTKSVEPVMHIAQTLLHRSSGQT